MIRFLLRILPAVPVWLGYFLLMTPLILVGFPLVALGAAWMQYRHKYVGHSREVPELHWPSRLMWLWDNDEDGIDGDPWASADAPLKNTEWFEATANWSVWRRIFVWSAWRNSVGNARRTPLFGMTVEPKKIRIYLPHMFACQFQTDEWPEYRKLGPYLARQGWRFELRFPWPTYSESLTPRFFWIGWRIAQCDEVTKNVGAVFQPWGKL